MTVSRWAPAIMLLPLLAGCSSSTDETVQVQDQAWTQAMDAGENALALERYPVAERSYREAARLALRRNDPAAISDAAYNLAVTQLAAGNATGALTTVAQARATLRIRAGEEAGPPGALPGAASTRQSTQTMAGPDLSGFDLISAAAYMRLNRLPQAGDSALRASQSPQQDIALRGSFLRGLVAAQTGQQDILQETIRQLAAVKPPRTAVLEGDQAELEALAVLRTEPQTAMARAARSADLRRQTGDYHAMAQALTVEARAARFAGQSDKASRLLAQAAQSLGARNSNGGDATDPQAAADMKAAGLSVPLQPFDIKDTSGEKTQQ